MLCCVSFVYYMNSHIEANELMPDELKSNFMLIVRFYCYYDYYAYYSYYADD